MAMSVASTPLLLAQRMSMELQHTMMRGAALNLLWYISMATVTTLRQWVLVVCGCYICLLVYVCEYHRLQQLVMVGVVTLSLAPVQLLQWLLVHLLLHCKQSMSKNSLIAVHILFKYCCCCFIIFSTSVPPWRGAMYNIFLYTQVTRPSYHTRWIGGRTVLDCGSAISMGLGPSMLSH